MDGLGEPAIVTGYSLFAIVLLLSVLNLRKRLPMLPLLRAHQWTRVHVVGGMLAAALYFLHTGSVWPVGPYERVLAALFYLVTLSGILGYLIQSLYPRRLTGTGVEIIYERIPAEVAELRERAEQLVLDCTKVSKSDTLARYYLETFDWFFRRPRFLLSHLTGGQKSGFWLEQQFINSRRYMNDKEREHLDRLETLAGLKSDIDFHFAAQRLMKTWLLVHVPGVVALLVLAAWHLLIVNIYAL